MAAYDLTTLANVKAWLSITSTANDPLLSRLITASSRFIVNYLSRGEILPADYVERQDGYGAGQTRIVLRRWPVVSIASLSLNGGPAIAASALPGVNVAPTSGWLLSDGDSVPPGSQQWLDLFGYCLARGPGAATISYRAGYAVMGEAATVPASGPYSVTAGQPYGAWGSDLGVTAAGLALAKVASAPASMQYSVDSAGVYTFNAAQANVAVKISYGYVPADLAQAANELVGARFQSRDSIGVNSKSLGGQETVSYDKRDMTGPVAAMLMNYRNVSVF